MVLSRPQLLEAIKAKNGLRFEPAVPDEAIEQVSIDLRLGRRFTTFKPGADHIASLQMDASLWAADLWENKEQDKFVLEPRELVLAQTLEVVTIPNNLMGMIEGRSSYARVGITVHVTAPKIDPGFHGPIVLEMTNFGKKPMTLRSSLDRPCQLILMKISSRLRPSETYGSKASHIFQFQKSAVPGKRP